MRIEKNLLLLYGAVAIFCFVSALRDVASEMLFKKSHSPISPIFALFVFSFIAQLVSAALYISKEMDYTAISKERNVLKNIVSANIFTVIAFVSYFFAINSSIGAALNATVDYGITPFVTVLLGSLLLKERFTKISIMLFAVSSIGICVLLYPRLQISSTRASSIIGVVFAVISSLSSAMYRVSFKNMLSSGMRKSEVMFSRLILITLILGIILVIFPELVDLRAIPELIVIGIVGFTLPLLISLYIIQRIELVRFGNMLFIVPSLTVVLGVYSGHMEFYISDIFGYIFVSFGVAANEYVSSSTVVHKV